MAKQDPRDARPSIMFLITHSAAGGAPEIWSNLAEGFAKRGYQVQLAALYPPPDGATQQATGGLDWFYVRDRKPVSLLGGAALFRDPVRFLRRHRPDVILTALPAAGVLVPLAARMLAPIPRIIVSHHSPVDTYAPILRRTEGLTGRLPNVVAAIAVSEAVGRSLDGRSKGYVAKRRIIHNSLPPAIEAQLQDLALRRPGRPDGRESRPDASPPKRTATSSSARWPGSPMPG